MSDGAAKALRKTPSKPDRPILWIIAGPNGCGKTSLYGRTDIEGWGGSVWIVNPDLLTARLIEVEHKSLNNANSAALDRIMEWLQASLDVHQTIGVETVLSSDKYRPLVLRAKELGFEIRLVYVVLRDVELQLERIRLRVSEGGHDVPSEKVISRRQRSFAQFTWFLQHADQCFVFDNSGGSPKLAAVWNGKSLDVFRSLPFDFLFELRDSRLKVVHHLR